MRIWLTGAVLLGTPLFFSTMMDLIKGSHHMKGEVWVGLAVPPALILFGTLLPQIGRTLGNADERLILVIYGRS